MGNLFDLVCLDSASIVLWSAWESQSNCDCSLLQISQAGFSLANLFKTSGVVSLSLTSSNCLMTFANSLLSPNSVRAIMATQRSGTSPLTILLASSENRSSARVYTSCSSTVLMLDITRFPLLASRTYLPSWVILLGVAYMQCSSVSTTY